jgi:hypothetical protein
MSQLQIEPLQKLFFKFSKQNLIRLKTLYKNKCTASKLNIIIPVPSDVYNPSFDPSIGKANYEGSI